MSHGDYNTVTVRGVLTAEVIAVSPQVCQPTASIPGLLELISDCPTFYPFVSATVPTPGLTKTSISSVSSSQTICRTSRTICPTPSCAIDSTSRTIYPAAPTSFEDEVHTSDAMLDSHGQGFSKPPQVQRSQRAFSAGGFLGKIVNFVLWVSASLFNSDLVRDSGLTSHCSLVYRLHFHSTLYVFKEKYLLKVIH